ncbi:hypothetical protein M422DRAFT_271792 [Sphaerobolus stellatus SS14]|uniref:Uncharacterized protein n=1 Tax=Sphaerobolus stellatus (strain SS14) TaxID=990650 RepID=A0A0C9TCX5_SPHS4|nr:hypothetical protein M422DRAFT_271792 [Sphaerobolus stellatus SS14]
MATFQFRRGLIPQTEEALPRLAKAMIKRPRILWGELRRAWTYVAKTRAEVATHVGSFVIPDYPKRLAASI